MIKPELQAQLCRFVWFQQRHFDWIVFLLTRVPCATTASKGWVGPIFGHRKPCKTKCTKYHCDTGPRQTIWKNNGTEWYKISSTHFGFELSLPEIKDNDSLHMKNNAWCSRSIGVWLLVNAQALSPNNFHGNLQCTSTVPNAVSNTQQQKHYTLRD